MRLTAVACRLTQGHVIVVEPFLVAVSKIRAK
jgi:hypothetical protein